MQNSSSKLFLYTVEATPHLSPLKYIREKDLPIHIQPTPSQWIFNDIPISYSFLNDFQIARHQIEKVEQGLKNSTPRLQYYESSQSILKII